MIKELIKCSGCGELHPLEAFNKDRTKPKRFGRSSTCKECLKLRRQEAKVAWVYVIRLRLFGWTYTYVGYTTDPKRPWGHYSKLCSSRNTHSKEFQRIFDLCKAINWNKQKTDWFDVEIFDFTDELAHLTESEREIKLKEYESSQMDMTCDEYILKGLNPSTYVLNVNYSDEIKPLDYLGTGSSAVQDYLEFMHDQEEEIREYASIFHGEY